MASRKLSKLTDSVHLIERSSDGSSEVTRLHKKKKKKHSNKAMKDLHRVTRHRLRATQAYVEKVLEMNDKHNSKKTDGWLRKSAKTHAKAAKASNRHLRKI